MDMALAQTLLSVRKAAPPSPTPRAPRPRRSLRRMCAVDLAKFSALHALQICRGLALPGSALRSHAGVCASRLTQVEAALDHEIEKADNLDEDDLQRIKAKRMQEMRKKAEEQQGNVANGHGKLMKINDQQEFFGAAKRSNRMIVIFTRNSNKYGKSMLEHMELLAGKHLEARFLWVDAENAPFLTERLNIYMLPTIVCIKDNKVHRQHNGLNEIDGSGKYSSGMLEYLLHTDEMLDEAPMYEEELREEEEELDDLED